VGKVFEEITQRDSGKGTRMTLVDLGFDTMIKYKKLYIKDIKSGTRRERERERAKVSNVGKKKKKAPSTTSHLRFTPMNFQK
jgi:alpha-glucuronidase